MMAESSPRRNLFSGDRLHLDHVGRDSFYGGLAKRRGSPLFVEGYLGEFACVGSETQDQSALKVV